MHVRHSVVGTVMGTDDHEFSVNDWRTAYAKGVSWCEAFKLCNQNMQAYSRARQQVQRWHPRKTRW